MWWGTRTKISETKRVAAVTRPKSGPDQLEDLLRRLLAAVDTPAPVPEAPTVEKLLQRLVVETQSRPSPVVSPPELVGLEKMLRSFLSGQQTASEAATSAATHQTGLERSCLFLTGSRVMLRLGVG